MSLTKATYSLINKAPINVLDYGLVGDGSDETSLLVTVITKAATESLPLYWPEDKEFGFTNINVLLANGYFEWVGNPKLTQVSTRTEGTNALELGGATVGSTTLASSSNVNSTSVTLTSAASAQVGDLIRLLTTRLMPLDHRNDPENSFSQLIKVSGIAGNVVNFDDPLVFGMDVGTLTTGTAQAGTSNTITLAASETKTSNELVGWLLRITAGTGVGQERYIITYDESTKVVGIGSQSIWATTPNATSVYTVVQEVSATIYRPAIIKSLPVNIKGYANAGVIVRGVQISFCDEPNLNLLQISAFSNHGLYTYRCYKATVSNCKITGANYITNTGGGLGYGHFDIGCFATQVYGNNVSNCRTCFDAIGGSLFLTRSNNTCIGGGKTYDGNDFWPIGIPQYLASGLSSHTGSYGVTDNGNLLMNIGYNKQRGLVQTFSNNVIKGACIQICLISYNDGLVCTGNVYQDGKTYRPTIYDRGTNGIINWGNNDSVRCEFFAYIRYETMINDASITIKNNFASALRNAMVTFEAPNVNQNIALSVTDNEVDVIPSSGSGVNTGAIVKSNAGSIAFRDLTMYSNRLSVNGVDLGSIVTDNMSFYPIIDQIGRASCRERVLEAV
jgi:hypothetical protein